MFELPRRSQIGDEFELLVGPTELLAGTPDLLSLNVLTVKNTMGELWTSACRSFDLGALGIEAPGFGSAFLEVGDLDGDGADDLLIGDPQAPAAGGATGRIWIMRIDDLARRPGQPIEQLPQPTTLHASR